MSTFAALLWIAFGALLGVVHATLVHRAAARPRLAMGLARLAVVGGGLTVAAVLGGILPAAGGWAAAFAVVIAWKAARSTRRDEGAA
jgi:hypothetical protein